MIDRYSLPEIAEIFSDRSKFARYLEIELLATEAQAKLGVVPQPALDLVAQAGVFFR